MTAAKKKTKPESMSSQSGLPCVFYLLRFVTERVRNEYVHIGVILREQNSEAPRTEIRFTRDWRRVRCLSPDADIGMFESMESELRQLFAAAPAASEDEIARLLKSLSNSVQITNSSGRYAESFPAALEDLMRLFVDPPPREKVPRLSGRAAIHARMRSEFERAGVWDLMRKRIAASDYTRPGDPLKIDAGYRPNGLIRMFHAVSLEPGVEMAKVLAFSAASLRAGVERVEKAQLELTAIIEPAAKLAATEDEPERLELYRFGVDTMEEHQIRVLTTTDLERVAETARRELRV